MTKIELYTTAMLFFSLVLGSAWLGTEGQKVAYNDCRKNASVEICVAHVGLEK